MMLASVSTVPPSEDANQTNHEEVSLDMENQRYGFEACKRREREMWLQRMTQEARFSLPQSRARAQMLVNEAWQMERLHLGHQLQHVKQLIKPNTVSSTAINEPDVLPCNCACIRAPACRLLTPKYRAMNLLQKRFQRNELERVVDTIRQTYLNDHEMMEDLVSRYGEEPAPAPALWLRSIEEKLKGLDDKWRAIGGAVNREMHDSDMFPVVIRNLSVMRIFLEGSQASEYGCDTTERLRRDALHQAVLDKLHMEGKLFVSD